MDFQRAVDEEKSFLQERDERLYARFICTRGDRDSRTSLDIRCDARHGQCYSRHDGNSETTPSSCRRGSMLVCLHSIATDSAIEGAQLESAIS